MSKVINAGASLLEAIAAKEAHQWLHVDWREVSSGGAMGPLPHLIQF